jgi:hypothetical protein
MIEWREIFSLLQRNYEDSPSEENSVYAVEKGLGFSLKLEKKI